MKLPVHGHFDHAGGNGSEGTVKVDRKARLFEVRVKYGRRSYALPIDRVAEMVVKAVLRSEAGDLPPAKVRRRGKL